MSVWFCVPSCRPAHEAKACFDKWREMGYRIAILRQGEPVEADLLIPTGEYLGWARSTNILAREVLRRDVTCNWVVGGGDDYLPVPDMEPGVIAFECGDYFGQREVGLNFHLSSFGVMQPTGDRWGDSESARATWGQDRGAILDRVAGSPWMGREWCERSYLGNGPMWDGYHHLYADEELCEVAEKLGVYWRRPDLVQYHAHPAREKGFGVYHKGHLKELYSKEAWTREKEMFDARKKSGFPGCEPCPR